ncbi:MAG: NAD-dependent epimerase/dehydratase family protein [Clostridium sp.]|nr:NAD-dependent epimerase/dehydratase family protein [Clostridium sp.]MBK5240800.1 NAD-dependent epimerase/dehydratase family protein [Clostridium sp.]
MKKILITGANSYIGISLMSLLEKYSDKYSVDELDMKDDSWKASDFSKYDVVFHVAGIAHVSTDPKMEDLYFKVNRDLTIETAKKAKKDGVKQFIFMSSIIIYGESRNVNERRIIDENTVPKPSNFYGESKLQAENGIKPLENDDFKIVILRPPMIYGKGSKGNYPKLSKAAQKLPVFPDIDNQRSMLHIDNLCEFTRLMIVNEESGVFFPQNSEYVKTSEMVKLIAQAHGTKIKLTNIFNPLLNLVGPKISIFNKVFGNLVYAQSLSDYKENYRIFDLRQSIIATETVDTTESVGTMKNN